MSLKTCLLSPISTGPPPTWRNVYQMRLSDRPPIRPDLRLDLAASLYPLLIPVVAGLAEGLERAAPELCLVTPVRLYVVAHRGGCQPPLVSAHPAEGLRLKLP